MIFPLSITMFPSEIPDVWCQIPRFVSHPSSFSAACHAKCLTALDSGQIELIELVLFDASGTIAVISVKRGPDRFLLLWPQQVLDVGICLQLKVLNNFISQHIYIYLNICIYIYILYIYIYLATWWDPHLPWVFAWIVGPQLWFQW